MTLVVVRWEWVGAGPEPEQDRPEWGHLHAGTVVDQARDAEEAVRWERRGWRLLVRSLGDAPEAARPWRPGGAS